MEGKRHDELLQDDASNEILSESGDSPASGSDWFIYTPSGSSLAGSEMSLVDLEKLSIHSKMTTIVHHDGRQFIERRDLDDGGGLPYSAEFYLNGEVWKLSGEDCVLMSPKRYIVKVVMEGQVDLSGVVDFEEAVRTLLKHLKVVEVLVDEDLDECNKAKIDLVMTLDKLIDESGGNKDCNRDVMLLRMLLKKHGNSLNMDFKHDLGNCSGLSGGRMTTLDSYVTKALELIQRNEILGHLNDSLLSYKFINDAIQQALNRHRARLAAICPSSMKDKLKKLSDERILYVTIDDMHLFSDLSALNEVICEAALPMIFSKYLARIEDLSDEHLADSDPVFNHIFLHVYKSLQEVAKQLGALIKTDSVIIYSEALGWEVINLKEESQTPHSKHLRQQLQMLAKLANHFEPGSPLRTSRFPYDFKLFQNMDTIPEPVRIWLCLLDDCMKDLVQADLDKMQMLSCFFKSYVSFMASENIRSEMLECLRTITHDALRSLADQASSQHNRATSDSGSLEFNNMISSCVQKFHRKHFGNVCDQIETTLQQIICKAMDMNVSSVELSKFSDVFKQLLNDLSNLQLEWLIQMTPSDKRSLLLQSQCIVPVDSKWKDTAYECFKVVDLENFEGMYKNLHSSEEMPKHYQLEVIQVLLQNLEKLASKQSWNNGRHNSKEHVLGGMILMIDSIRSSLVLLEKQRNYASFEVFLLLMSKLSTQKRKEKEQELTHTDDRFEGDKSDVLLQNGLKIYTTQFNRYIKESEGLSRSRRIHQIVSDIKSKMSQRVEPVTSWTEQFKRNELPQVLAGLSAVWNLVSHKGFSQTGMKMKLADLQIRCILKLFSEQNKDDAHHLLQILNPQEKEFVQGLIAALLALCGHKVHIICFNNYLSRLNSVDWIDVFWNFSILSKISYESLNDVARNRFKGVGEKYTAYINECFGFGTTPHIDNEPEKAPEDERSVLLIEDIDIILQDDSFRQFVRPTIPGLMEVQRLVFSKDTIIYDDEIAQYIKLSTNSKIMELRAFLDRPNSYTLLESNPYHEFEYTNKKFFRKQLEAMKRAKSMTKYCSGKDIRQLVINCESYGHLSFGYIPFPYDSLLKSFPFVLGFTCATLDKSDERILNNRYSLQLKTPESDIFQPIPTRFDSTQDFFYVESKNDWNDAMKVAVKAAINRSCVVLVFYKGRKSIQTPDLPSLTVTPFTTASNRENFGDHDILENDIHGLVVYTGQLSKDRQIHVIQTFFSNDEREENLVRRQAVRSHSSGSYELIIHAECKKTPNAHYYKNPKEKVTYESLVKNRLHFNDREKEDRSARNTRQFIKIKKFLKLQ